MSTTPLSLSFSHEESINHFPSPVTSPTVSHDVSIPQQARKEDKDSFAHEAYSFKFDITLCFQLIGMTSVLSFLLIVIPLGFDGEVNDWFFVFYQLVYCWLAFNLTRYMFEFTTPGISVMLHYSIFGGATFAVIIFFILYFSGVREEGNLGTGIVRILPTSIFVAAVSVGYFIHALQSKSVPDCSDNTMTTTSPYRTELDFLQIDLSNYEVMLLKKPLSNTSWQEFFGFWPQLTELKDVSVRGPVFRQWLRSVVMLMSVSGVYIYCQTLALQFSNAENFLGEFGIYTLFTVSFLLIKPIIRKLGNLVDQNKTGGPSLELLMEVSIYFFYFTFERNLFISVHSYGDFFLLKSAYVLFELLSNTVTFHKWYHNALVNLFARYKHSPVFLQLLKIAAGGEFADLALQVQCLRMGMKLYMLLTTAFTFILYFVFLRFGYNRVFYCLYREISNDDFSILMNITLMSVIIEILLFIFADYLYFYNFQRRGILCTWERLLRGQFIGIPNTTVVMYVIWLMTHVTTDLYISRIDVSDIGGIDCPDVD